MKDQKEKQIYFHSHFCSDLPRVPILVEGTVFLSWAPQTRTDSSQAPFKLFPVPDHHIHRSSFKRTHSRQFQSCPSSALRLFFSYFPHVSILSTADTDFVAHRTVRVWTSTFPTRVARFSQQNTPNCYSKLAQSRFEGGSPVNLGQNFRPGNLTRIQAIPYTHNKFWNRTTIFFVWPSSSLHKKVSIPRLGPCKIIKGYLLNFHFPF